MATLKPHGESFLNGHHGPASPAAENPWNDVEALRQEVERLTAENQQLMSMVAGGAGEGTELDQLRTENEQLRATVAALEQMVTGGDAPADWAEQQREYESLLEEKSEVIRSLHQKLQETRTDTTAPRPGGLGAGANVGAVNNQQLQALKEELERQREQLEEDEESLMTQMRQMEMSMARERAELARQRTELQRLHADLKHEIEQASRDGSLRERLNNLQRRQPEAPKTAPPAPPAETTPSTKNSGVLKRLFRPGQQ